MWHWCSSSPRGQARKLPKPSPSPQPGSQEDAPSSLDKPAVPAAAQTATSPLKARAAEAMQLDDDSAGHPSSDASDEATQQDSSEAESSGGSWDSPRAPKVVKRGPKGKARAQGRKLYRVPAQQGATGPRQAGPTQLQTAGPIDLSSPGASRPADADAGHADAKGGAGVSHTVHY